MARDTEQLVLQLSADLRTFQNQMLRAAGEADRAAQRVERRFQQLNKTLVRDFQSFSNNVRTVLATVGVGMIARDVVELGDVWTRVGNRLSFAGVEAERLAAAQHLVADIAMRTRADLESTADLFARMLRSSEDLGASMGEVAAVTEIVNMALAGASQAERSSAIRQLGQGLGSGRLQGDELRSILENSRPIAEAIAAEFETTIGNLRNLGKQGELESRRVFEAILRAGPEIEEAFSRTAVTVEDSFTRLRTAAARFVGTNEQTAGAVKGLSNLINFVANNFDALADSVVVVATVLGGAVLGRAIAAALAGLAGIATSATTARAALAFLGGPFGLALTALGATYAYVATQTDLLTSKTQLLQRANDSAYSALQRIASLSEDLETLAEQGENAAEGTRQLSSSGEAARAALRDLGGTTDDTGKKLDDLGRIASALATIERDRTLATINQSIADNDAAAAAIRRSMALRGLLQATTADGMAARREGENWAAPSAEEARQLNALTRQNIDLILARNAVNQIDLKTWEQLVNLGGGAADQSERTASASSRTTLELERQYELELARLQGNVARVRMIEDGIDAERRMTAYIEAGMDAVRARAIAEAEVADLREAAHQQALRNYELQQLQDQIELARLRNQYALVEALQEEVQLRQRARQIVDELGVSEELALKQAQQYIDALRAARAEERDAALNVRDLEHAAEVARERGDERAEAAIRRQLELAKRIADLRRLGVADEAAAARAAAELQALEDANAQGAFRRWFSGGVMAALEGDLDDFFENWIRDRAAAGLEAALNEVADVIFEAFRGVLTQVIQNGQDGLGQAVAAIFTTGTKTGMKDIGESAGAAARVLDKVFSAAAADAAVKIAIQGAQSAATATKEASAAAAKQTTAFQLIAAERALTSSAYAAASALSALASAGGASGGAGFVGDLLGAILGGFSGGSSAGRIFAGFRAGGGPMDAFKAYMVGERGPEMVVPNVPSFVIPNGALGGRAVTIVDNTTINIQGASTAEMAQLRAEMRGDLATRRQQIISVVDDAFGRRQVLQG